MILILMMVLSCININLQKKEKAIEKKEDLERIKLYLQRGEAEKIIKEIEEIDKKSLQKLDNITDENGKTLLYLASQEGEEEVVKLLLKLGVDVDGSNNGETAFMIASLKGHNKIVKLLSETKSQKPKLLKFSRLINGVKF